MCGCMHDRFTDDDRDSALSKMTACAIQYDSNHPSALKLTSFDCLTLNAHQFKEALRQTFNLQLNPREHGALFRHFCRREGNIHLIINIPPLIHTLHTIPYTRPFPLFGAMFRHFCRREGIIHLHPLINRYLPSTRLIHALNSPSHSMSISLPSRTQYHHHCLSHTTTTNTIITPHTLSPPCFLPFTPMPPCCHRHHRRLASSHRHRALKTTGRSTRRSSSTYSYR